MVSRNYDLSQTPSDSILIFPDVPASPPSAGSFLGAVTSSTKLAQLGFFAPGAVYIPIAGGTMSGPLILSRDPQSAMEAATKRYTDLMLPLTGGQMSGALSLFGDGTQPLHAVTFQQLNTKLNIAGGTMTGNLFLNTDPSSDLQASTKAYVDSHTQAVANLYLPLVGGTLSGPLTVNADLTVSGGNVIHAGSPLMPDLAWWITGSAGNIPMGLDNTGMLMVQRLQVFSSATLSNVAINNVNLTGTFGFTGDLNVTGNLSASGNATFLGQTVTLNALTFLNGDLEQPGSSIMPDLARWVRDTAGNVALALDTKGVLVVQQLQVLGSATMTNPSLIGNLSTTGNFAAAGTGSFGGPITVPAITFTNGDLEQVVSPLMPDLSRWVRDPAGNVNFAFATNGDIIVNNLQVVGTLTAPGFAGGGGGDDPNSFTPLLISSRDAMATANSMAVKGQTNSQIAQPIWTHNMVLIYGQSLSVGNQGLPRMSTDEALDNLTLGLAPGGTQTSTDYVFIPDTNSNINALDGTRGYETPGISATNQWRALQLQWRDLAADPTRRLIVNGCGEGGKAIEELSKGYVTTPYYNRIPSLLNQVKTAVTAANASNTFGVTAVYYLQGEANYSAAFDNTQAGYAAKWEQLRTDITADVKAITGQKLAPAFFASQPNSEWDNANPLLAVSAIANAFIQVGITAPLGDYLCMPNYAAPNSNPNGPHMSPDGYRYMGNGVGKIMHRVLDRGEGWLPLYVVTATYRGKQIMLQCHVPEPPLQIKQFYGGTDGSTIQPVLSDYGFSAGDDLGSLTFTNIQLYNAVIVITCSRAVSTNAWVDYANRGHSGNGNVCDSDPFLSLDIFKTLPIDMIGKPYPSWNWMVAFRMSVTSDV